MGFFELFSTALAGFYAVIPSYGLAIILLTLAVRLLLLPLSIKQTKSMREMQAIQPEIKRLQAKHKGDRQKMNEELMALYKEHGVNPFGGCLPLLMQFPILIGLFYVIRSPLKYMGDVVEGSALADGLGRVASALDINQFLGIRLNCSASGTLTGNSTADLDGLDRALADACGSGLVTALPYLLLVLLMGFTTYYQQKQMQKSTPDSPQAQQMQMFAKIMPLMLMVFSFNFPAGVVVYWVTTNLWTIVQQRMILAAHPLPAAAGGPAPKKPPATAKAATASPSKASSNGGKRPAAAASKPHPSSKKKRKK
ncbi:MAG: YidC/Oxa1 family membrane protein insertase [Actinomycetota bacterium]|nr:YidC/Oxa1 family membrane protein insertase [Actinomycetota bacterium]